MLMPKSKVIVILSTGRSAEARPSLWGEGRKQEEVCGGTRCTPPPFGRCDSCLASPELEGKGTGQSKAMLAHSTAAPPGLPGQMPRGHGGKLLHVERPLARGEKGA